MSKWLVRVLIFLGASIPYVYLAMNDDGSNSSMMFYGLMVIALGVLTVVAVKTKNITIHMLGNLISFIISYFFILAHQTERWSWYFKPFSPIGMLLFISCIVWVIQILFILYHKAKQTRSLK